MIYLIIAMLLLCIITGILEIKLFSLRRQYLVLKSSLKPVYGCFGGFVVMTNKLVPHGQIWINPDNSLMGVTK